MYYGINDGYLYTVDAVTGKEKWRFQARGLCFSFLAVDLGVLDVILSFRNVSWQKLQKITRDLWQTQNQIPIFSFNLQRYKAYPWKI